MRTRVSFSICASHRNEFAKYGKAWCIAISEAIESVWFEPIPIVRSSLWMMVRPMTPRIWFDATLMFAIFTAQIPVFAGVRNAGRGVAVAKDAQINGDN